MQSTTCLVFAAVYVYMYVAAVSTGFGSAQMCTDDTREARLEAVRQNILFKLQFSRPPENPKGSIVTSKEKLDEYQAIAAAQDVINGDRTQCTEYNQYAHDILVFFPTYSTVFSHQYHVTQPLPSDSGSGDAINRDPSEDHHFTDRYRLKFLLNLTDVDLITKAELRLYKRPRPRESHHDITEERVDLVLIKHPEDFGQRYWGEELLQTISSQFITSDSEGYVIFNATYAIQEWIEWDETNVFREIELEVRIRCPESMYMQFTPSIEFDLDNNKTTQLVIQYYQQRKNSKKRQIRDDIDSEYCLSHPEEFKCCLRPLEINFVRDFNWRWIIQPKSIPVNYCEGLCPYNWGHYGYHSVFQELLRRRNPTAAPVPCCAPNKFKPLTIQFVVNGSIFIHALPDVQVLACICR